MQSTHNPNRKQLIENSTDTVANKRQKGVGVGSS